MNQFPWSESGKELLKELQLRVDLAGGRERLARDIESEWKDTSKLIDKWEPYEVDILLKNKFDLDKVERLTGRSHCASTHKLRKIKEQIKLKQLLFK